MLSTDCESAATGRQVHGLLKRLHDRAAERLSRVYAPGSRGALSSALKAFARFASQCPERVLFKSPNGEATSEATAWNEWTFVLFAMYMESTPSEKTRRVVQARTTELYISLLKGYLSFSYDFDVVDRAPRLKRLLSEMKSQDPLHLSRRRRRGLRRRHLRRMWATLPGVRESSPEAVNAHALLTTAWQVLARGGELAPQVKTWSPDVGPSRADLFFDETREGRRYAVLWLRPLKKKAGRREPKAPQYICEFDGGGSDTYAALRRLVEIDRVAPEDEANTPLFRDYRGRTRGRHFTVAAMRSLVRERMHAIGYVVSKEWGAHSCRIGGATDLVSTGKASPLLLQAKGRWASDIGRIYARMTRRCHLAASELMQKAKGRDVEELFPDFVQAAL